MVTMVRMRCLLSILLLSAATPFSPTRLATRHRSHRLRRRLLASADTANGGDGGTVLRLEDPSGSGRSVVLVGTAHLSRASNEQVTRVIETERPDVVVIELDPSRLERIGIEGGVNGLGLPCATADAIDPPRLPEDDDRPRPFWAPLEYLFLEVAARIARMMLTNMYDDMGKGMGGDEVDETLKGGGEFLAALQAAQDEKNGVERIVLADRDSVSTLRRFAELTLRSGDPVGVLSRLGEANAAELQSVEDRVRRSLGDDADEAAVRVALVETVKADAGMRSRLFSRLEREVPEFTRAFLTERDFIMAEAIRREVSRGARRVVVVVGLAHVPGLADGLRDTATWG